MASSFAEQIPCIVNLLQTLKPKSILDIGKGFGKYGFLIHEYVGIDNQKQINPSLTLAQQSNIKVDAVEADKDLLLPHLDQLYSKVYVGDVTEIYHDFPKYDLIMMIDIIEHLDKEKAIGIVKYFLSMGSTLVIATPINFFEQNLYGSHYEHHVSHWALKDFKKLGYTDSQYFNGGAVYLVSNEKIEMRSFGNSIFKKLKRVRRILKNEFK